MICFTIRIVIDFLLLVILLPKSVDFDIPFLSSPSLCLEKEKQKDDKKRKDFLISYHFKTTKDTTNINLKV